MHRMSSRIVSCQFFRGLPLLRFPSGLLSMACTLCTARLSPSILATCLNQRSLLLLIMFPKSSCPVLSHITLFVIVITIIIIIVEQRAYMKIKIGFVLKLRKYQPFTTTSPRLYSSNKEPHPRSNGGAGHCESGFKIPVCDRKLSDNGWGPRSRYRRNFNRRQ